MDHNQRLEPYNDLFKENEWAYFLISKIDLRRQNDVNISVLLSTNIKKGPLINVVSFLKKSFTESYPNAVQGLTFKQSATKVELANLIIKFVRQSQPQLCSTCESDYYPYSQEDNDSGRDNEVKCFLCKMPSHADCVDETRINENLGIVFLCHNCLQPQEASDPKNSPEYKTTSATESPLQPAQKQKAKKSPKKSSEESSELYESPHLPSSDSDSETNKSLNNKSKKKNKSRRCKKTETSEGSSSENANPNQKKNQRDREKDKSKEEKRNSIQQICRFFERGLCRFGVSGTKDGKCKFKHPRICKRVINHGPKSPYGCKGDCDKWHPKLCYSSINKKECLKEYCSFWHIKGTARSKNSEEITEPLTEQVKEKTEESKSASFLGPIQGQMTQMLSQQQELFQKEMLQMVQFMNQMNRQIQVLTARHQNIPLLPNQVLPQAATLPHQLRNPAQQPPVVLNAQA